MFARAREKARQASCQSNLKQLALGVLMYAQDYDERLPIRWAVLPSGAYLYIPDLIFPYVKNSQLFECPSWSQNLTSLYMGLPLTTPSPLPAVALSYGWLGGSPAHPASPCTICGRTCGKNYHCFDGYRGVKIGTIDSPANTIMIHERVSVLCPDYDNGVHTFSNYFEQEAYHAHNAGNNFAFQDGHVKALATLDAGQCTPSSDDDK